MRLIFSADAVFVDKPGGAQTVAWELATQLVERGHAVDFLVAAHNGAQSGKSVDRGLSIHRYPGAGHLLAYLWEGYRAARRVNQSQPAPSLLHSHFAYASLGPSRALKLIPVVRTFHGSWPEEGLVEDLEAAGNSPLRRVRARAKYLFRKRIEQGDLRRSRRIIILSEFSRGQLAGLGSNDERVRLIPGGADITRFSPAVDRSITRQRLGLPPHQKILFTVRRLAARMGLDRLIAAMPAVVRKHPDVLLLIGGKGPEKEKLQANIDQLQLHQHVRLIGFIPDNDLPLDHQAADLFLLPTVALEGFGLVTVEALASGTPVLGTPVGATPEILAGLDERLLTESAEVGALSQGILRFWEGDWRQELTPQRLHDFVRARYTWERHTEGVLAVYREILDGHGGIS